MVLIQLTGNLKDYFYIVKVTQQENLGFTLGFPILWIGSYLWFQITLVVNILFTLQLFFRFISLSRKKVGARYKLQRHFILIFLRLKSVRLNL